MPAERTEITEITTGLAMLGFPRLERALATRPEWFVNVGDRQYDVLERAHRSGRYAEEFAVAWHTGRRFLESIDGLRGRVPDRLEWKGPAKPPGYDQIPADLQADHVYLLSCKYRSNILLNTSPPHLFERRLAERRGERFDWFEAVAPEAHQALYAGARRHVGEGRLPEQVAALTADDRKLLKAGLPKRTRWPEALEPLYRDFVNAVSQATAQRWLECLPKPAQREEMVWRLLRLQPAPYFVLGTSAAGDPLGFRVATPSEFRQDFEVSGFDSWNPVAGQPTVTWRADVRARADGAPWVIEGHVEIRWSQGRFGGFPEAKVYLDTPHHRVPGYVPLA